VRDQESGGVHEVFRPL
jgi:hypothetical protein